MLAISALFAPAAHVRPLQCRRDVLRAASLATLQVALPVLADNEAEFDEATILFHAEEGILSATPEQQLTKDGKMVDPRTIEDCTQLVSLIAADEEAGRRGGSYQPAR